MDQKPRKYVVVFSPKKPAADSLSSYRWYLDGKLHHDDDPAVTYSDGSFVYFCHGRVHRLDGPAISYRGHKEWRVDGKLHRLGGPAIERANGNNEYWVDGVRQEGIQ